MVHVMYITMIHGMYITMLPCYLHHGGAGDTEEEGEELGRAARPQRAQGVQAAPPAAG